MTEENTSLYVRLLLELAEEPEWYHVNEQEAFGIRVPDGSYASIVESLADQGISDWSHLYFYDFAPLVHVEADGWYRVDRHKMFRGVRDGECVSLLLTPLKKRYLPYDADPA